LRVGEAGEFGVNEFAGSAFGLELMQFGDAAAEGVVGRGAGASGFGRIGLDRVRFGEPVEAVDCGGNFPGEGSFEDTFGGQFAGQDDSGSKGSAEVGRF
jgi:hypothetical protein